MRTAWLATSALVLLLPAPLPGQTSPHAVMPEDGEDFCGRVFLRAQGRVFGHELVEFFFLPSVEGNPEDALAPDLAGPVRADRAGLWWPSAPDSLGAYMEGDEGTVWELRLGRTPAVFEGTLRLAFPRRESPHVAAAYVVRAPCQERAGGPGG